MALTYNHDSESDPCTICGREGEHIHWRATEEGQWLLDHDPDSLPPLSEEARRAIASERARPSPFILSHIEFRFSADVPRERFWLLPSRDIEF